MANTMCTIYRQDQVTTTKANMEDARASSFQKLPAEIRNMTYRTVLVSEKRIYLNTLSGKFSGVQLQLARVCQQVWTEAYGILFGETRFQHTLLHSPEQSKKSFLKMLGDKKAGLILDIAMMLATGLEDVFIPPQLCCSMCAIL